MNGKAVETTKKGDTYTFTIENVKKDQTVVVTTAGTEEIAADVYLSFSKSARVTIDGETYTSNATLKLIEGKEYEIVVDWAGSVTNAADKVIYENLTALDDFSSKYFFTANDEDKLVIGAVTVTGVKVVDGTDGYTPVTTPVVDQVLAANLALSNADFAGTYPAPGAVTYKWEDVTSGKTLGTDSRLIVTGDHVGVTIKVTATVSGTSVTWTATAPVA